jgi:hypothetical protein
MSQKLSASRKNHRIVKKDEEKQLTNHPAWKGSYFVSQKKILLLDQKPFSYLLGLSEQKDQFAVAWVQENGLIADSSFGYNPQTKTWFYSNGSPHECKHFEDLLSSMFHCSREDLSPCR